MIETISYDADIVTNIIPYDIFQLKKDLHVTGNKTNKKWNMAIVLFSKQLWMEIIHGHTR